MLFNSLTFLIFFAAVLAVHQLPISWRARKLNLLLASYLFYAAWDPPFVVLIWISTLTDWWVARRLEAARGQLRRRALLLVSLAVNLGLLGYFKYAGFVLTNFVALTGLMGFDYQPATPNIILPLGISFYTFQTLSYSISVYRRELRPAGSFLDFALFVTFFPQLVAGPILRAGDFLPQLVRPRRASGRQLGWGFTLLTFGLFEKVVLSDALVAPLADRVFGSVAEAGQLDAWVGTLAFSSQIFFDFAGYSSCAIGAALCLGFVVPENFLGPYASVGFSEFWRRWHISLSTWLRDYLYISMGGNRQGRGRTYVNLGATMLLGGLWHGAAWTFVIWGGLHGSYLMIERWLREHVPDFASFRTRPFQVGVGLLTFVVVTITWIFFRAQGVGDAFTLVGTLVSGGPANLVSAQDVGLVFALVALMLAAHTWLRERDLESVVSGTPIWIRVLALAIPLLALILAPGEDRAFIYFQF